jgi:hypothetical protein
MKVAISDEIKELKRERHMRSRLYPEWVKMCKLTPEEARWQILCLDSAIQRLEALEKQNNGQQSALF